MKDTLNSRVAATKPGWLEIMLFIMPGDAVNTEDIQGWLEAGHLIHIAAPFPRTGFIPEGIKWYEYSLVNSKKDVFNRLYTSSDASWTLFLDSGEYVSPGDLPDWASLDGASYVETCIQYPDKDKTGMYYQVRLLRAGMENPFSGKNFPFFRNPEGALPADGQLVTVYRNRSVFFNVDPDEELSEITLSPRAYLFIGKKELDNHRFVPAAALFRRVIHSDKLSHSDYLSALNGLAECLAEQHRWDQALEMTNRSVEAESDQFMPYLIQFRIYQLRKQWQNAHEALEALYRCKPERSRASFDVRHPEVELLKLLADIAFKAGLRAESFAYYETLYDRHTSTFDNNHIKLLFIFAAELSDFEKSVKYFNVMFGDFLPDRLTPHIKSEIVECLQVFVEKGWYDFPCQVYQELFEHNPQYPEMRRHLVACLSKSKNIDKARYILRLKTV